MKLTAFQVQNYRCVNNSGRIELDDCVALVGRNESGKTNLLLALASLNPPSREVAALSFVKDFPRDRPKTEFSEDLPVVESWWQLDKEEQAQLTSIFPRADGVQRVAIGRSYQPEQRWVGFEDLQDLSVDATAIKEALDKAKRSINGALAKAGEKTKEEILGAVERLLNVASPAEPLIPWAKGLDQALEKLRSTCQQHDVTIPENADTQLNHAESLVDAVVNDEQRHADARSWIVKQMPIFVYIAEYPELNGHQDLNELIEALDGQIDKKDEHVNFERLCKVAGLDPHELQGLLRKDHEERQQLVNRAGFVVSKKIRELWKDRQLTVRFNLDEKHFDTLVSDPSAVYPVEINFDDRSRGFKWFFSFYIAFAADTAGGPSENAILLMDEPGLYLHAVAQRDLLDHFASDFKNQIVYTTHSPFMIPTHNLASVRTVNINSDEGTTVTNDPRGDSKTLFPLQTALGYDLSQTLFVGAKNLVVEGVTDYWYISSISDFLRDNGSSALPDDLVITPAGGAQKVPYMVSLLTSQNLQVLVLLDAEASAERSRDDLVKTKLIRDDGVLSVADAWDGSRNEADIEDLLDPDTFRTLVASSYEAELKGNTLALNDNIPRIVKRYEDAFSKIGLEFHKTRPARLFLRLIATEPETVLPTTTRDRFAGLFRVVNDRLTKQMASNRQPFQ